VDKVLNLNNKKVPKNISKSLSRKTRKNKTKQKKKNFASTQTEEEGENWDKLPPAH